MPLKITRRCPWGPLTVRDFRSFFVRRDLFRHSGSLLCESSGNRAPPGGIVRDRAECRAGIGSALRVVLEQEVGRPEMSLDRGLRLRALKTRLIEGHLLHVTIDRVAALSKREAREENMTPNDATQSTIGSNSEFVQSVKSVKSVKRGNGLSAMNPVRSQTPSLRSSDRARPLSRSRGRLASARDRQRLRERQFAERARVEEMLATAPIPLPAPSVSPSPSLSPSPSPSPSPSASQELIAFVPEGPSRLRGLRPQPSTCPVCASEKVVCDEVVSGGLLKLSECLHCEHRWTKRPRAHTRPRSVLTPASIAPGAGH